MTTEISVMYGSEKVNANPLITFTIMFYFVQCVVVGNVCVSILFRYWITCCRWQCLRQYFLSFMHHSLSLAVFASVFYIVHASLVVVGSVCVSFLYRSQYFTSFRYDSLSLALCVSVFCIVLVSLVFVMLISAALSSDVRCSVQL